MAEEDNVQSLPVEGQEPVMPLLRKEFADLADSRWKIGVERYGRPLETHNGRDAGRDAIEEWFDLGIYLQQLRKENEDLKTDHQLLLTAVEGVIKSLEEVREESSSQFPPLSRYIDSVLQVLRAAT